MLQIYARWDYPFKSKECQKTAWPRHKLACKILQPPEVYSNPTALKALNDLRAFTAKVRPALMLWGFPAFNLKNDIKRGERDVLVVNLRKRPDAKRPELAFECVDTYLKAIDSFPPPNNQAVRAQVDNCQKDSIASGALAGVVMLLIDLDSYVSNAVPFAFDESLFVDHPQPGALWKQVLMHHINSGKSLGSNLL
ncbi:hypothetical protein D9619_010071 [Psilocybe cf. subviscida]|uniref:MYND-type domain-containing protein n=1 Tax=Psilocybe cf. subviscida TaxID=2480587 RepID=A0A8H5BL01_9AGAR|nr:hypothetical protein D9619_010071 [Psilocybe cf. subviscida]